MAPASTSRSIRWKAPPCAPRTCRERLPPWPWPKGARCSMRPTSIWKRSPSVPAMRRGSLISMRRPRRISAPLPRPRASRPRRSRRSSSTDRAMPILLLRCARRALRCGSSRTAMLRASSTRPIRERPVRHVSSGVRGGTGGAWPAILCPPRPKRARGGRDARGPRAARGASCPPYNGSTASRHVLRDPAPEGPVFFRDLHEIDHHILAPHFQLVVKVVDNTLVKCLFQVDRASGTERDLDENHIIAVSITHVAFGDVQPFRRMFSDDLEFVILRHIDHVDHGLVYNIAQCLLVLDGFATNEIDTHERHGNAP